MTSIRTSSCGLISPDYAGPPPSRKKVTLLGREDFFAADIAAEGELMPASSLEHRFSGAPASSEPTMSSSSTQPFVVVGAAAALPVQKIRLVASEAAEGRTRLTLMKPRQRTGRTGGHLEKPS